MNATSLSGPTLEALGATLWRELAGAAQDRAHEWRQPVLATVCPEFGPQARTVVLREVDVASRTLLLYTDARSPKVAQLQADPRAQLLCWSRALGWQLRLGGRILVSTEGLDVTSRWALLRHTRAAQDYLSPQRPGQPIAVTEVDAPAEGLAETERADSSRAERAHFAVLRLRVERMDWLSLDPQGHRRAVFDARDAGLSGRWCVP
ncbi:hypothetical protein X805_35460 [Sphaerotilus natans subsp. natans DSM 6575]|uniref:Pyridoxamine 5'-phosphate oxidase Alr4036 family FMN-binding domain-containing protein n=1 Tax=Sphaerotilus natans subsp. natans DSM 6575 TaxID=1286631 RepID=A0A059KHZ4_9BURK|nr:pyridoxamine 5'-phosphate oxidase family protein [Sphaerotilus natans]KDB50854.1 hypothetical protein X805_35460 [Sphaerotilus natans subsp. natans DSM 6575]SIQ75163.1 Pyridoxamine 5'-phosphate oxidase [Sphaerotilus natans]